MAHTTASRPLVSICIATNGKTEWTIPVIESVYAQTDVDESLYEVICTDNGSSDELSKAVTAIKHANFHYYRSEAPGFTNQIVAFEKACGEFRKLQNARCVMLPGSLASIIELAQRYRCTKPAIYCTNLGKAPETVECGDFDSFLLELGILSTWSGGTCAWDEDIARIRDYPIDVEFPHTAAFFLPGKTGYVVYNAHISNSLDDAGKGGYNPFKTFLVTYPTLLQGLVRDGRISEATFEALKEILLDFISGTVVGEVILPTKYTFDYSNLRSHVEVFYGRKGYRRLIGKCIIHAPGILRSRLKAALKRKR